MEITVLSDWRSRTVRIILTAELALSKIAKRLKSRLQSCFQDNWEFLNSASINRRKFCMIITIISALADWESAAEAEGWLAWAGVLQPGRPVDPRTGQSGRSGGRHICHQEGTGSYQAGKDLFLEFSSTNCYKPDFQVMCHFCLLSGRLE